MTTIRTPTIDADTLRRAFTGRDADALAAMYTDDATLELVDAEHPPSRPLRVEGRQAIDAYVADLVSRDMTHAVEDVAVGEDAIGYTVRCVYPDGMRVVCAATGALRDGRIARQVIAQAWDDAAQDSGA